LRREAWDDNGRTMKWLLAMSVLAGAATAQVTPYGLKVETGPGLVAITFSTQQSQVRAYFPDDVAAGESFSGALEGQPNYVLEFAGQRARVRDGVFHWTMPGTGPAAEPGLQPADAAPQFVPLILRDFRGHEVARASIPVAEKRPGFPSFRLPKFVHAGSPAPVLGPFDGDAESSSFVIDGKPAQVLAESVRKMVVRAPEQVLGPVPFTMKKGEIERGGILRSLQMDTSTPDHATLGISVKGLRGLQDEIPLRLESDYIFIRPADVGAEGDFHTQVALLGIESNVSEMEARLVFPQTPRDEVGLILRTPRKDRRQDVAQEHAAALRLLDFDVLPVLQDFIADYDVGSDAAYAMLAADEQRALPLLLGSMPFSGPNVERIGFVWILSHFDAAKPNASAREAHAAAVRVLGVPASSSEAVELALHTLGVSGSAEDLPLLDQHYQYRNGWSGLRRIQDASEAALARLGSRPHLENIRTELAATVTADSTPDRAVRIGQVLQKAGFAGQPELLPAVCRHLGDPAITDIDVTWDPKLSAVAALNAIVNHTTPMARPDRRTLEEWKSYCRQPGAR
jgi:hypothetical protein